MFWNLGKAKEGELPRPKDIPRLVGSHMVVEGKKNPDWVWKLKGVLLPTEKKKAFYCRVFSETQATQAGVNVKDWNSLDAHSDLILWEGYFDLEANTVRPEKFVKPSSATN